MKLPRDRWIAGALALYVATLVGWLLLSGARLTREDGFYYFKIAQNVAAGLGSTFDGLHPTNGYHPLWLLCLVPLFWAAPDPQLALRLAIALQGLLLAAAAAALYLGARLHLGRAAAALAALLWVAVVYPEGVSGLEFSLHALLVLAAACVFRRWFAGGPSPTLAAHAGLGLLLTLAALARLENALLALLVALYTVRGAQRQPSRAARLLAVGLPVVLVFLLYLGLNTALFGQPMPVSGEVKRDWSAHLLKQDPVYAAAGWPAAKLRELLWPLRNAGHAHPLALTLGGFVLPALLAASARARRPPRWLEGMRPWAPFVLFAPLQLLAYAVIYHGEAGYAGAPWYFVVQPWLAALGAAAALEAAASWSGRRLPRLAPMLVPIAAAAVAAGIAVAMALWQTRHFDRVTYDSAHWAREHLPPRAVIGSWHAGALGYLSGRRVVNLDGLVNSPEFHRRDQYDLCRYWDRAGIEYLVDMFQGTRAAVYEPAYAAYARCESRLERVWPLEGKDEGWRVAVYRIRPTGTP